MKHRQREAEAIRQVIMNHRMTGQARIGFLSNKYTLSRKSQGFTHVLALELLQLSM